MEKKEFIEKLKSAYNDPSCFFVNGKVSGEKLQEFFQGFVDAFLQPSMQGLTDKKPEVSFIEFDEKQTKVANPTGKYERDDSGKDKIIMSVKRFASCKNEAEFKNALLEVMGIVCHEYHHFKQSVYGDMLESGDTEKAAAIQAQMKISKEEFMHATGPAKYRYDQLEFMEKTMPWSVIKTKLIGRHFGTTSKGVIKDAFYFRNPIEKDARDSSLEVYSEIAREIGATAGDKNLAEHMEDVGKRQGLKNRIDDARQPKRVIDSFENELKKISPKHFIKFSELIDKESKKPNKSKEQEEKIEHLKYTFTETLKATKMMLGEEKFSKFVEEILKVCPEGSFAHEAAKSELGEIKQPTTERLTRQELEEIRGREKEENSVTVQRAHEVAQELGLEDEQELAAQMVKRIDD